MLHARVDDRRRGVYPTGRITRSGAIFVGIDPPSAADGGGAAAAPRVGRGVVLLRQRGDVAGCARLASVVALCGRAEERLHSLPDGGALAHGGLLARDANLPVRAQDRGRTAQAASPIRTDAASSAASASVSSTRASARRPKAITPAATATDAAATM